MTNLKAFPSFRKMRVWQAPHWQAATLNPTTKRCGYGSNFKPPKKDQMLEVFVFCLCLFFRIIRWPRLKAHGDLQLWFRAHGLTACPLFVRLFQQPVKPGWRLKIVSQWSALGFVQRCVTGTITDIPRCVTRLVWQTSLSNGRKVGHSVRCTHVIGHVWNINEGTTLFLVPRKRNK